LRGATAGMSSHRTGSTEDWQRTFYISKLFRELLGPLLFSVKFEQKTLELIFFFGLFLSVPVGDSGVNQ
jgi:hypothetical protein